jgi:transcriptional regulator with XRE-family HTH domain
MARAVDLKRLLARNVRRLRKAHGLSQSALAIDAGQHQHVISMIENGKVDVRMGTVAKIAAALGVHPRDLLED